MLLLLLSCKCPCGSRFCITHSLKTHHASLLSTPLYTRVLTQSQHSRSLHHKQPSLYHLYLIFHRQAFRGAIFSSVPFPLDPYNLLCIHSVVPRTTKTAPTYPSFLILQWPILRNLSDTPSRNMTDTNTWNLYLALLVLRVLTVCVLEYMSCARQ